MGEEAFGAYLVLRWGDPADVTEYLCHLVRDGFEPVLVSPADMVLPSDMEIEALPPEQGERNLGKGSGPRICRALREHLRTGERRAVVIYGLQLLREGSFRELTDMIDMLYDEACVNHGLVLLFADPAGFTPQELAFLRRETSAIERPEQLP